MGAIRMWTVAIAIASLIQGCKPVQEDTAGTEGIVGIRARFSKTSTVRCPTSLAERLALVNNTMREACQSLNRTSTPAGRQSPCNANQCPAGTELRDLQFSKVIATATPFAESESPSAPADVPAIWQVTLEASAPLPAQGTVSCVNPNETPLFLSINRAIEEKCNGKDESTSAP